MGAFAATIIACVGLFFSHAETAEAQPRAQPPSQAVSVERPALNIVKFLGGAALGLGLHEAGHLTFDLIFDADPGLRAVRFGPMPFFAITHRGDVTARQEFAMASAGFWVQHGVSEVLLTSDPEMRDGRNSYAKGLLAFNVLASVAYAGAAFARSGPSERDTRGMAASLSTDERRVGAMLLVPAFLDGYRYYHPRARWASWGSRAAKAAMVLLVVKAGKRPGRP